VNRIGLRKLWFHIHKWIGLLLAILIVPLSLSGAVLVWHDALDKALNPQRFAVGGGGARLAPAAYVTAARRALPEGARIASIRYPQHEGPLTVNAIAPSEPGGPPARVMVWLDPPTGRLLDRAGGNEGLVRFIHNLHGNLLMPGIGRQIVGWLGVAMLLSALSGLWLWLPATGRWLRGLRWRRARGFENNLHHQMGFWIAIPLAMLSFTGVWISFPQFFAALTGPAGEPRAASERAQRIRPQPLEAPHLTPDAALATAGGGRPVSISWPTEMDPAWRVSVAGRSEIRVTDATGRKESGDGGGSAQGAARLMRRLHDGTGMGAIWQTIIFIAGILPSALAVTGVIMWLRARRWRGDLAQRARRLRHGGHSAKAELR
jgi:uncharacterized iron-regulated membrane protein